MGSVRCEFKGDGTNVGYTHYYPSGIEITDAGKSQTLRGKDRYNGKELQMQFGLNIYDYHARGFDGAVGRFWQIDPLAEKKPWLSPYAFCRNNPLRFIDPDGRDEWEINKDGHIVNRIENKNQDSFHIVDTDGNRTTKEDGSENSIVFEHGTVKSSKEEVGNIDGVNVKMTSFNIGGDDNATQLFEFMANPQETTNVEWTHLKVGKASGDDGLNIVGTSHNESSSQVSRQGNSIRGIVHNHPSNYDIMSRQDKETRGKLLNENPNMEYSIYSTKWGYRPFATLQDLIKFYTRDYE